MINRGTEIRDSRVGSLINFCDCAAKIQFVHVTKHTARTRLQFEHTQRLRDDADQLDHRRVSASGVFAYVGGDRGTISEEESRWKESRYRAISYAPEVYIHRGDWWVRDNDCDCNGARYLFVAIRSQFCRWSSLRRKGGRRWIFHEARSDRCS